MKIYINRQVRRNVPWGGGARFVETMADFLISCGNTLSEKLVSDIDAIIMIDPRPEDSFAGFNEILQFKRSHPHVKIMHRINDSDRHRYRDFDTRPKNQLLDSMICTANVIADQTVFISNWLAREYESNMGYSLQLGTRDHVIINGCDTNIFFPQQTLYDTRITLRELTSEHLSLMHEQISAPFVMKKLHLASHHWSNNLLKGFDIYHALDDYLAEHPDANFDFTFIGRYDARPRRATKLVAPLAGSALADELRKYDAYVTGARFEPSGMHDVEAAACGLPVFYHKDGGAIPEKCQHHECSTEFDSSESLIKHFLPENIDNTRKNITFKRMLLTDRQDIRRFLSAERMCEQYYKIICDMMK